ncbi:LAFE_0F05094g1_1 [Lachancea fermentati]|uniref:LAFE_0F05094g1_1 n=1 Tax=Lachancea fermentati TaxID=4955 RepID=A0A1G4MEU0_LACFM|nr:LAFE_0F05094g1_1 [Lachancea fermentati]
MESTVDRLTKVLIAQYLARNGYDGSLSNFLKETSLPRSVTDENDVYEPLEKIVAERIEFNEHAVSTKLEELSINNKLAPLDSKFFVPSWDSTRKFEPLPHIAQPNSLAIEISFDHTGAILAATAGREIALYNSNLQLVKQVGTGGGIVKKCGTIPSLKGVTYYYACQADGSLIIYDKELEVIAKHKLHRRIITHIEFFILNDSTLLCFSCGLDNYIKLHKIILATQSVECCDEVKLISTCTSFQLSQTEKSEPILFVSRMDFTQVMVLTVSRNRFLEKCRIALNSAQFSTHSFNVWNLIVFNLKPSSSKETNSHLIMLRDDTMLAVATSHTPYMRLILVEVPPFCSCPAEDLRSDFPKEVDATGSLSNPGVKTYFDKILRNIATTIQQDSFSQPVLKAFTVARGLLLGGDHGVWAIDISNGDTWQLLPVDDRVKTMDVEDERIAISFANKELQVWQCK